MSTVLEADNLRIAWPGGEPVVADLNLSVHENEMVCLVGKSGLGKTTILHALAGLLVPQVGRVLLRGNDVTGKPGRVSYMLQKDLLLPNLTVADNACLPLLLADIPKAQARERALPLLERFGLADAADKWPAELSGGMRQRVAFARTCMQGNDVVLLDEPFSALDAITRADIRSWFRNMAAELGLTALMITHDPDEAALIADRVYVLGRPKPEEGDAGGADAGVPRHTHGGRNADGPATIVGEVAPSRPAGAAKDVAEYALTTEFLAAKSSILALL